MKRIFYSILIAGLTLLTSCTADSDSSDKVPDNTAITEEKLATMGEEEVMAAAEKAEEKSKVMEAVAEEVVEEKVVAEELTNKIEVDETEIKKAAAEAQKKREQVVNKQLASSPLKDKDCGQIFSDYEAIVKKYLSTGEESILDPLSSWANDPIFNACKKDEAFKKKFEALEEEMMMAEY